MVEYAVKFMCGKSEGRVAARGRYFTTINVHNPSGSGMEFRKKVAIALPGEKAGPMSDWITAKLENDEALEIDCPNIREHAPYKAEFITGFVVIQSEEELDVVAVYTVEGLFGAVKTIHTERVPARKS